MNYYPAESTTKANLLYKEIKHIKIYKVKGILLLFTLLFYNLTAINSQVFTGSNGPIVDFVDEPYHTLYSATVKDLPISIDNNFGLEKICIHLRHKRTRDLKIELMSPNGETVWLTNRNKSTLHYGYFDTCFKQNGFNGEIIEDSPSFKGEFSPEGRLEFINNGQNPNGTWYLLITDLEEKVVGSLIDWSITFSNNPAKIIEGNCSETNVIDCLPKGHQDVSFTPDLIISPSLSRDHIEYFGSDDTTNIYNNQIRLAVAMANIGSGPFEIEGSGIWECGEEEVEQHSVCNDGSAPRQQVIQKIYARQNDTLAKIDNPAGYLYFDNKPGHNHYHVDDWVTFSLLKKCWWSRNPSKWKVIGTSNKISYCLFDNKICTSANEYCQSDGVTYSEENLTNFGFGKYNSCNSALQGISVGGIDYYGKFYEGQFINLPADMKPGTYYIHINVDPLNLYRESNENNNSVLIKVKFEIQDNRLKMIVIDDKA